MTLPVRPGILEIAPYVGGEAGLPGANRVVRLASNENPLGPSAQAVAAYQALSGELHRYSASSGKVRLALETHIVHARNGLAQGLGRSAFGEQYGKLRATVRGQVTGRLEHLLLRSDVSVEHAQRDAAHTIGTDHGKQQCHAHEHDERDAATGAGRGRGVTVVAWKVLPCDGHFLLFRWQIGLKMRTC